MTAVNFIAAEQQRLQAIKNAHDRLVAARMRLHSWTGRGKKRADYRVNIEPPEWRDYPPNQRWLSFDVPDGFITQRLIDEVRSAERAFILTGGTE